jgi:hypothetical protein
VVTNGQAGNPSPGVTLLVGLLLIVVGLSFLRFRDLLYVKLNPFRRTDLDDSEKDSGMYLFSAILVPSLWVLAGVGLVLSVIF